jgi:hypothetical protein
MTGWRSGIEVGLPEWEAVYVCRDRRVDIAGAPLWVIRAYVAPSFRWAVTPEPGHPDVEGQAGTLEDATLEAEKALAEVMESET